MSALNKESEMTEKVTNNWQLMMTSCVSYELGESVKWMPLYVRHDSPKMITYRWLSGRCGQTQPEFIDYPKLHKTERARLSSWNIRKPSAEELAKYEPLLNEALSHDLPKYAEGY